MGAQRVPVCVCAGMRLCLCVCGACLCVCLLVLARMHVGPYSSNKNEKNDRMTIISVGRGPCHFQNRILYWTCLLAVRPRAGSDCLFVRVMPFAPAGQRSAVSGPRSRPALSSSSASLNPSRSRSRCWLVTAQSRRSHGAVTVGFPVTALTVTCPPPLTSLGRD